MSTEATTAPLDIAALRIQLQPLAHRHIAAGRCSCGFDAYKIQGIMIDYHEETLAHFRRAERGPSYRPLSREDALALLDEVERLRAAEVSR